MFSSIFSDIKLVKTGLRLFAELHLGILLLGGLSRQGIADSLEIRGSACNVSVYCIDMSKKNMYISYGPNFRETIFIPPF